MVKNPPAMQEMQVQSLGQEDPLEKEMATHFRILAWIIPWTEEPRSLQSIGAQRDRHNWTYTYNASTSLPTVLFLNSQNNRSYDNGVSASLII